MATDLNTIFAGISSAGIFFAGCQLLITYKQSVTAFEDGIAREYRELAGRLPTGALLGEAISDEEHQESFDEFYHYFDLTNEQIFLRQYGRIRRWTWENWRDGIRSNIRRPAFARAWTEIKERSNGDFNGLRRLIDAEFKEDPKSWSRRRTR
jgi:hypothetical protein